MLWRIDKLSILYVGNESSFPAVWNILIGNEIDVGESARYHWLQPEKNKNISDRDLKPQLSPKFTNRLEGIRHARVFLPQERKTLPKLNWTGLT